jgi:hypothetical protein
MLYANGLCCDQNLNGQHIIDVQAAWRNELRLSRARVVYFFGVAHCQEGARIRGLIHDVPSWS